MITGIVIGALSAAAFLPQTDTIVQANGASRLELSSMQGEVTVLAWDRDAVQVKADHSDSFSIDISRSGSTISVEPEVNRGYGMSGGADFEITVPRGFDLDIEGMALDVDIRGVEGQVEVGTVHGPITLIGGTGNIVLESVNGAVHLEGAQGDIDVTGIAGGVTIKDCSGDIYAESVGGDLILEGVRSSDVEIGSVGGDMRYEGTIEDGGTYNFGSHGGRIYLFLPANVNAQFDMISLAGDIVIDYPGAPSEPVKGRGIPGMSGKELSFELGTGSARIEVETFGGTVHIRRAGG